MKKYAQLIIFLLPAFLLSSCDLMQGDGDNDPNVNEETFLKSESAMQNWVNGSEMQLARAVGQYSQLLEILSDDYYNQYSRSSSTFDKPSLLNTDGHVQILQRWVGTLRESADYGFNVVSKRDTKFSDVQKFKLHCIKGYSFVLGGETFTGLPMESGGDVHPWGDLLKEAINEFNIALTLAPSDSDKATVNTFLARTYYRLGDKAQAKQYAEAALANDPELTTFVHFDGKNNVNNVAQEAIWDNWFQPLPRLDFLDPKYFKTYATEERPICIAKAEEDYLIIAEAELADGNLDAAKSMLRRLLDLVGKREVRNIVDDNCNLYNNADKPYPMLADYKVRASKDDPYRSGLVQTRTDSTYVKVPIISGTSVDADMIQQAGSVDELLEIVYLMRQEIFFGEGRRAADLGIRLPLCDVEAAHTSSAKGYDEALIPPFIPTNGEMDNFDLDAENKTVTIHYNMNRIIVENKNSQYVAPLFK